MIRTCDRKGFDAVEFDNLDSWTRFDDTPREGDVPFGKRAAIAYARRLIRRAHRRGLAAAQKNTTQITRRQARAASASTSRSPRSAACTTSAATSGGCTATT